MTQKNGLWNDANVEKLKALWITGKTCSEIANAIPGATRSGVAGKASRLDLPSRAPVYPPKPRKKAFHFGDGVEKPITASKPIEPEPEPLRISAYDITRGQCRWPHNDPSDLSTFYFCGHPAEGRSYCSFHERVARPVAQVAKDAT